MTDAIKRLRDAAYQPNWGVSYLSFTDAERILTDAVAAERTKVGDVLIQWAMGWVSVPPTPAMMHVSWAAFHDKITEVCGGTHD